jgi:hypothetical protein
MTASLETLVIAAYVFAESLPIPRSGPPGKATDTELIALSVAQAAMGISSDRQFLGLIDKVLPGWFPALPHQSRYNRRLRRLTPQITTVQLMVAEGRVRPADGTLISCANYPGYASKSHFAGDAAYGYSPSKSQFVWGMRLVVICDPRASRWAMTWSAPRLERSASRSSGSPPRIPKACCFATAASGAPSMRARCS